MECPVCLEAKPVGVATVVAPWACTHATCAGCCYELVARQAVGATCPLCRAALAAPYRTTFTSADKFVLIAADGSALRGDHVSRTVVAAIAPTDGRRAWLNMDGVCMAMRTDEDHHMLYMASGILTDMFVELFETVPRFAGPRSDASLDGDRQGRADRRDLTRTLGGFITHDQSENILEFLRTAAWPVRLVFEDE